MNIKLDSLIGRWCRTRLGSKLKFQIVGYYMNEEDYRPRLVLLAGDGSMIPVVIFDVMLIDDNQSPATVS